MKTYILLLAVTLTTPNLAHAFGSKPATVPGPSVPAPGSGCPTPGSVQAADLASIMDQKFIDEMKRLQVNTVIRYYDHTNETLSGKTLRASELDLVKRNGLDLMVVFQHYNNQITSFTAARGTSDANRTLQLAAQNRQPAGSAIYFGVDGGWYTAADVTKIKTYFTKAAPIVRAAGYKMGAYGSGMVCTELLKAGLTDYCWLSNATGWPGYQAFHATKQWTMVQKLPVKCGGKDVDFNVVNNEMREIGSWRP